jgi:hypothetical protein
MWHKTVIARIRHRCVKKTVDDERPRLFVEFILDGVTAYRHLDNDVYVMGWVAANSNCVDTHG